MTVTVQNFVPGGLGGWVFYDYNNDGILQSGKEDSIAGTLIRLSGTNSQGAGGLLVRNF